MSRSRLYALCTVGLQAFALAAQTAPPPKSDTLILNDDEKLIGHMVRSSGSSLVFKSDLLGEITVDWSKVKELHTSESYAVLRKQVELKHKSNAAAVPRGTLDATAQTITVHPPSGAPVTVPVADAGHVVDLSTFENDLLHNPGFFEAWGGAVTAGAAIVQATQQSRAFSGAVHLIRAIPMESWMPPTNRTLVDFSASSGFVAQPNTPRVKTEILHASVERDEYFNTSRVFAFGQAIWDHNYSQGLDLQQNYGGGIGWTAIQKPNLTLDLKGSANYVKQTFIVQPPALSAPGHNLIASNFAEDLLRKFPRGMIFLQNLTFTPAWNEMHAWVAMAGASFTVPVYKRLSFNISLQDNFLNDPPPGFKKNSLQAATGLTYILR
jgi:hypothetical protein